MLIISKLSNWYFSKRAMPYWGILFIDLISIIISALVVYTLGKGATYVAIHFVPLVRTFAAYLLVYLVMFRLFHTYSGILRYSSFTDLVRIGGAMSLGTLIIYIIRLYEPALNLLEPISIRAQIMCAMAATLTMLMVRIGVKTLFQMFITNDQAPRTFVYGTQAGGVSIAKNIYNTKPMKFNLAGFISDDEKMKGKMLMGKKVYLLKPGIIDIMKKRNISVLLVSPLKNDKLRENKEFISALIEANIRIMMLPTTIEWDGKSDIMASSLKPVEVEDLLPRDQINVDLKAIGNLLRDKTILITGAAGSIGSEMVRQVAKFAPRKLILVDQAETPMHDIRLLMANQFPNIEAHTIVTSITKEEQMEHIFADHRPDYVFHAAAYKHVPMMEDNPANAIQNNCYGTRVIADLAVKYGTQKFVMISTDKAVNPTNVMGCSKRICEIYCQSLNKAIAEGKIKGVTQFVTTRFGNVLGSNGSVIPLFRKQLAKGGPLTVTHPDIIRYFMLIPEACKLVLEAGTMGKGGEIFVFDMGKPVRIADLAKRMIELSGAKNVEIKYTGLRDGEKLYEELLNNKEQTMPTPHPKIMVAKVREYDYESAKKDEEELLRLSYTYDDMAIVRKMKEIVPEYRSQNSKYQELDKQQA